MIKLNRGVEPNILINKKDEWTKKLIDKINYFGGYEFIPDDVKKSVVSHYSHDEIKSVLIDTTFKKCAFCECLPEDGGGYIQVEHFHPKSIYPNECFSWENFLPSCGICNNNKGTLDTKVTPIINPYDDDPKKSFYCNFLKVLPLKNDQKAINTEREIMLNSNRLINSRTELLRKLQILTEELRDSIVYLKEADTDRKISNRKSKLDQKIQEIEFYMHPKSIHSFFCSQVIENDCHYIEAKTLL
ncbi:TPA: hypothetical protein PXJ58_000564 [Yersinia enterocolitica]|uniref:hypothetical protein n=1 Tax=Yersinia enterocolitica TaxID=630 RepID=UPI00065975D7|nr:hypothetical protein [Yersinia enterocolitica]CRX47364.1 Uncharacterised protein [Yersinia enterocolitica]HDL6736651.1 hypothetical protein [Yersinia enterocolitica]HDL7722970.1 hypothetical protein [Yersinia enterocolitica]HEI6905983.1 hypothetical protein [Yersinia enterocolitica]